MQFSQIISVNGPCANKHALQLKNKCHMTKSVHIPIKTC